MPLACTSREAAVADGNASRTMDLHSALFIEPNDASRMQTQFVGRQIKPVALFVMPSFRFRPGGDLSEEVFGRHGEPISGETEKGRPSHPG
ncbi:Uncharacterised protein [Paenibacillus thiaminolyticus]|nr:Uncharacterised protein [Paenibacillus thiaminolyticus]